MMTVLLWQVIFSSMSAYAFCLLVGHLNAWVAGFALLFGSLLSWWFCRCIQPIEKQFQKSRKTRQSVLQLDSPLLSRNQHFTSYNPLRARKVDRMLCQVTLTLSVFLGLYHFTFLFFKKSGVWWTGLAQNVGDLPLHLGFIRHLAGGGEFLPHNIELARDFLRYPLAVDLYSALFETLGVPTQIHLFLFGLLGFAFTLFFLMEWGGWWMVCAFVFSGSLYDFLSPQVIEKAALEPMWRNLFTYVFIPQRTMQLALPFGVWWLSRWWSVFPLSRLRVPQLLRDGTVNEKASVIFVASLGLMAFVHLHSFVILTALAFLIFLYFQKQERLSGIGYLILVLVISLPFVIFSSRMGEAAQVVHLSGTWWLGHKSDFWVGVLNFSPMLAAWGMAMLWPGSRFFDRRLMGSVFLLWIVSSFLIVAPWDWDQIKILIWVYLVLSYLFYQWLRTQAPGVQLQLAVVLILSGVFAQFHELNHVDKKAMLVADVDLQIASKATTGLDRRAIFLAAPTFDHPLVFLGFKRMLGYEGHVWSHGLNASKEQGVIEKLKSHTLDNQEATWIDEAKRLGVQYLYWSKIERDLFGDLDLQEKARLTLVSQVDEVEIYEL